MDEQPRRGPLTLAYRIAGISLAILLVTTMATGWLYLLRAGVAHGPGRGSRTRCRWTSCPAPTASRCSATSPCSPWPGPCSGWWPGRCG